MISELDLLEQFAYNNDILILTSYLPEKISGYCYIDEDLNIKSITLGTHIDTTIKKTCVLAEEIEHYITAPANLFSASKITREKYEYIAWLGAAKRLVTLDNLIDARLNFIDNIFDLTDYLNVTEEFLFQSLGAYKKHYGFSTVHRGFIIYFDPFYIEKAS